MTDQCSSTVMAVCDVEDRAPHFCPRMVEYVDQREKPYPLTSGTSVGGLLDWGLQYHVAKHICVAGWSCLIRCGILHVWQGPMPFQKRLLEKSQAIVNM